MKDKNSIFEFNEVTFDAMHRFLASNSIMAKIANFILNIFWYFGKLIKKILGKDKIEKPILENKIEKKNIDNNVTLTDLLILKKNLDDIDDNSIIFIDLKKELDDVSGAIDFGNYEIKELANNNSVFVLNYTRKWGDWYLGIYGRKIEIPLKQFSDIALLLDIKRIDTIVINNLAYYPNPEELIDDICLIKKKFNIKIEMHFNDYLAICPSFFLLNKEGKPCGNPTENDCKECLYNSPYRTLIRNDINLWRNSFSKLFNNVEKFYFYSMYTQNLFFSVYPKIKNKSILKKHEVLFSQDYTRYIKPKKSKIIRIGYVGTFTPLKGSYYYVEVINKLKENGYNVEPIIIGSIDEPKVGYKTTGRYERNNLGKLLSDNEINMVIFASANNETFSYVAQELMTLNVPFTLFSCGAPKERIIEENYVLAEIAEEVTSESLYESTIKLLKKLELI